MAAGERLVPGSLLRSLTCGLSLLSCSMRGKVALRGFSLLGGALDRLCLLGCQLCGSPRGLLCCCFLRRQLCSLLCGVLGGLSRGQPGYLLGSMFCCLASRQQR